MGTVSCTRCTKSRNTAPCSCCATSRCPCEWCGMVECECIDADLDPCEYLGDYHEDPELS